MKEFPNWFNKQIEQHENEKGNKCGCKVENMELCLAGQYLNDLIEIEELKENF